MTLQRRVLGYLALAATASCALTVTVAVVLVKHRISSQRMATLETQAGILALAGGAPGALSAGQHVYRVGTGRPHRVRPAARAAVLAAIPSGPDAHGTTTVAGRTVLYVARGTPAGRIVLIRPAGLAFSEWRPFLVSLVLAGLGSAVLAALLAYLLARRLTRPIGELADATRRLAAGEPGVAVPIGGDKELAELGRAFNEMSSDLERANETQRRFLESVSHELKTPLTSIHGYAEALREGAVSPAEGGRVIGAESERLQRLVFDLLDLARLRRAGFSVARDPVELSALAAQAVARHGPRAAEIGVELSSTGAPEAWVVGDAGRILQAVSNLIENALRLTPAGGRVTVITGPGELSVSDTGPGLAPDDIPHAFERFYLHDRYRSDRADGSGLGLAIVHELVGALGGTVQASSPDGSGAQFTLRLAAAGAPEPAASSRDGPL
jgi:two-component system sensor histidine kinase BaeS